MNSYGSRQQGICFGAYYGEEAKRAGQERRGPVVCPKPRRAARLAGPELLRPLTRFNIPELVEPSDRNDSGEVLDIFRRKGAETNQIASSPPYFCGSPPSRTTNPLVHDKRFGQEDPATQIFLPVPVPVLQPVLSKAASPVSTPVSTSCCKGYAPIKFGFQPATMRIEGFDCLNRDRRGCGITAIA